ncbi:hypothetical protein [Mycolicibacterium goodii]
MAAVDAACSSARRQQATRVAVQAEAMASAATDFNTTDEGNANAISVTV